MIRYAITDEKPVRPIELRFGILSAEEIEEMAVCEVTETSLYYRGLPATGGLLDPLMGTVDRRHLCASCMRGPSTCQGHPGFMKMAFPVYHIGFIDTVLKTLRMVCFCCSRLCLTEEETAAAGGSCGGKQRFTMIYLAAKSKKVCPHCGMTQPQLTRGPHSIKVTWPADMQWESDEEEAYCTSTFTARDALSILRHIPQQEVESMGFSSSSRPENMIVQNLVIPPPCTRPAIYSSEGSRSRGQNDLTIRLVEVLKRSNEVKHSMGGEDWRTFPNSAIDDDFVETLSKLQYEVFMLVNNSSRTQKPAGMGRNSSGVHNKSIQERLKGKEGRIRGNLMGKRVDFSARAVITPDAYFECDRVGVPYRIAMSLTIPETVNAVNVGSLTKKVRLGASNLNGAQKIIHKNGCVTDLKHRKLHEDIVLSMGDVVERHLQDDDWVVFNRQPSLHMHGMQAHRVRLMPGHTFRLSLVTASPYNADFDGDEMNIHVPQSKMAQAECATLMAVAQHCIGAQSNRPVMGIVQDSLLGLHILTLQTTLVDKPHACRLVGSLRHVKEKRLPPPAITIKQKNGTERRWWTGKQMFSVLLPKDFYIEVDLDEEVKWKDSELPVVVRGGQLLCGVLRKAHVGTSAGGVVDVLCREKGGVACMRFMGDAQRLTHAFLLQHGHHVGIKDVMLSMPGQEAVAERLLKAEHLCEEIQKEVFDASKDVQCMAESSILRLLSKMLMQTGGIVNEHMPEENSIRRMVTAGSKGSFINLSQICASLGQQSLEGSRIIADRGRRTLPCFSVDDITLSSRGMVKNSFALGLTPSELFFHAVGGREGLVDTAVKTSQTGYLQRRMNKSMEDNCLRNDGTVRNSLDDIICFLWGSDGFHPSSLERVKMNLLTESEERIRSRMTRDESELALECRSQIRRVKSALNCSCDQDQRVLLPFHPHRLRKALDRKRNRRLSGVDPAKAAERMLDLARGQPVVVSAAICDVLSSGCMEGISDVDNVQILQDVKDLIDRAKAVAGESVGCIAAQSIGEPCTQLTLNTFHSAGVGAKNMTLGIPRLKELLDGTKVPKTPFTVVRFRHPFNKSKVFADYFANTVPHMRLGDIVSNCDVVYDPDPCHTNIKDDQWIVFAESVLEILDRNDASNFVIRLTMSQDVMRRRCLTPPIVKRLVAERMAGRAHVCCSETNAVDWIMRIRLYHIKDMIQLGNVGDRESIMCYRVTNVLLETVLVNGHPDVSSAEVVETAGEFTVHTIGSFLTHCTASQCVDWSRCMTNDVWMVYKTLGVEACVHILFDQIKAVVSFDGGYVDDRHILLIVDSMCRGGAIMPLNRHGINRTEDSPLMRCSFEETMDVLCDAAIFSEKEEANGVSASIMMGQISAMGTGASKVLFPDFDMHRRGFKSKGGTVLRSTCRSFKRLAEEDVIEYVLDDVQPSSSGRELKRDRKRFRPGSPTPTSETEV